MATDEREVPLTTTCAGCSHVAAHHSRAMHSRCEFKHCGCPRFVRSDDRRDEYLKGVVDERNRVIGWLRGVVLWDKSRWREAGASLADALARDELVTDIHPPTAPVQARATRASDLGWPLGLVVRYDDYGAREVAEIDFSAVRLDERRSAVEYLRRTAKEMPMAQRDALTQAADAIESGNW